MYKVKLGEIFEGPFNLLLYLIQRNELDIYEIPISRITSEYLHYINIMQNMNLNISGDFLVTAATLMKIKAYSLLPVKNIEEMEDIIDTKEELTRRLIRYSKFKELGQKFGDRRNRQKLYFTASHDGIVKTDKKHCKQETPEMLIRILKLLLKRQKIADTYERNILRIRIEHIIDKLKSKMEYNRRYDLKELIDKKDIQHLIVTFIAILELDRTNYLNIYQNALFNPIEIERH